MQNRLMWTLPSSTAEVSAGAGNCITVRKDNDPEEQHELLVGLGLQ